MTDDERLEIASAPALWDWLGANHGRDRGLWLVTWKKAAGAAYVDREAVLDALVAHGWTDGRRRMLDATRTEHWIAPRRQPVWAQTYKDRAARLLAEGRMHPAGLASLMAAQASAMWNASAPVDALLVPEDLRAGLVAAGGAAWFDAAAPSYRRNVLRWLAGARSPQTRANRTSLIAAHAARGEKVPQY